MNRLALAASAVAVLLSGCGGLPQSATTRSAPVAPVAPRTMPTSASLNATTSGQLVVTQQGSSPARTRWYLRVEDTAAKPLVEKAFPDRRIALTRSFPASEYRLIVWHRSCSGICPTTGEVGLGPLEQVCGTQVSLAPARQVKATVAIGADGACTVKADD